MTIRTRARQLNIVFVRLVETSAMTHWSHCFGIRLWLRAWKQGNVVKVGRLLLWTR